MSVLKGIDETIDSGVEQWSETVDGIAAKIKNGLAQDFKSLQGLPLSSKIIQGTIQIFADKWVRYCESIHWEARYEIFEGRLVMNLKPDRTIRYYKIDVTVSDECPY